MAKKTVMMIQQMNDSEKKDRPPWNVLEQHGQHENTLVSIILFFKSPYGIQKEKNK